MSDYIIITDSSCDLPDDVAAHLGVKVVPLSLTLGGKEYLNTTDARGIPNKELYARLRAGEVSKTSAANADVFVAAMEPEMQAGRDVLYIGFSSALSATCQVGANVGREMMEKYPGRKVYTVDSLCASLGQGLFVYLLAQKKREGMELEALRDYAEELKLHICHWFTVNDLNYLKKGGRVSAATAFVGTMLSIKPIMHTSDEGKLTVVGKARGRKSSLNTLIDTVGRLGIDLQEQTMFICQADCRAEAEAVAAELKRRYGVKEVYINYIGPVIGSHTGPDTMGLFFVGTER